MAARWLVRFGLGVVAFDVVWALTCRLAGTDYAALWWVSFLIYASAGFTVARSYGLIGGLLAGAFTALIDATVGWAASALIGPGRVSNGLMGVVLTVVTVVATGAACGAVAGWFGRRFPLVLVHSPPPTNPYHGTQEFSSNFDLEWLEPFVSELRSGGMGVPGQLSTDIEEAARKVKGDTKALERLEFTISHEGRNSSIYVHTEWDNALGYILRAYGEAAVIKQIEKAWVAAMERLGV